MAAVNVTNTPNSVNSPGNIQVIELHMMDKRKYFPLTVFSSFSVRAVLHPFGLIKTRLQIQKHSGVYKGTFDAFRKILHYEGVPGLYRGFLIQSAMVVPSLCYISTYETVRRLLTEKVNLHHDAKMKSFIAGGCASMVGQTFVVPIDTVSQYLMMLGRTHSTKKSHVAHMVPLDIPKEAFESRFGMSKAVIQALYKKEGVLGFYRGYFASLAVYAPNSAMWWLFYDIYCDKLASISPEWVPRLALQVVAAPLGGITTSILTNPMDIIRARIQVERTMFLETTKILWKEEHLRIFTKGLPARLIQSVVFSFMIILGYESLKRVSLREEYKDSVRW